VEREVMWAPWEGPGLEHLRLVTSDGGVVANGLVIGLEAGRPFRITYEIRCDERWRVREVRAAAPDSRRPVLELLADGEGHWQRRGGEPLPELDGCIDVDISATPFTNTLPIRRLGLEPGESEELVVTYVRVPELLVGQRGSATVVWRRKWTAGSTAWRRCRAGSQPSYRSTQTGW
jgi:hypothetical protein